MHQTSHPTGVCVVRVETQRSGTLLITVVTNPDIDEVSAQHSCQVTEVDAAIAAVRDFLLDFTKGMTA